MAYGAFNAGSGASTYDLDMMAAEVISGNVKAPLTTTNGLVIATQDGKQILAYAISQEQTCDDAAVTFATAGAVRLIERYQAQYLADMQSLIMSLMSGQLVIPLADNRGTAIITRSGVNIMAVRKL